jgi:hypothetical protein
MFLYFRLIAQYSPKRNEFGKKAYNYHHRPGAPVRPAAATVQPATALQLEHFPEAS